jgi:N-acetylglucosamine-6-phosphate deacetylase
VIRPLDFTELNALWAASRKTLKILTVAPEKLSAPQLKQLAAWAKPKAVRLSLGHSSATTLQAEEAFSQGFSGVTHAWNALSFHHRSPGALGAALGRKGVHVEIIIDGVHVDPKIVEWTRRLHGKGVCFISDCVPSGETQAGGWHSFGKLAIRFDRGASRLPEGHLAGGGYALGSVYSRWLDSEAVRLGTRSEVILKETVIHVTDSPREALGLDPATLKRLRSMRVGWKRADGALRAFPID